MRTKILAIIVVGLEAGCSSPVTQAEPEQKSVQLQSLLASGAAGYQHTIEHSQFALGSNVQARDEFGMHKVVGDQGVFATRSSGMITALTNADSAARQGKPIGDNAMHNDAVREYFLRAGIPADQIAAVQDSEVMIAPASDQPDGPKRTVLYRYSMLKRSIRGILVPDSFAWARMNVDGTVVEEQVYWPPIPQSVIDAALEFSTRLKDKMTRSAFEGQLPPHREALDVVVRHSPGEWDGPFFVNAYFDILPRQSFPAVLHVTQSGAIVKLPFEEPGAWGPEVSSTRKVR